MESDWSKGNKSHYATETISWLGFADVIFGGDKQQPEIRLHSKANLLIKVQPASSMANCLPCDQALSYMQIGEKGMGMGMGIGMSYVSDS